MNHDSSATHTRIGKYRGLAALFIFVLFVQISIGIVVYLGFDTPEHRGTFGDMFGVVNTLFTGLAFAGVIYAIILQSKELEMQREVLEATRDELSKSASAHAEIVRAQDKAQESIHLTMVNDHDRRKKQATIEYMASIRPIWKKTRRALNDAFGTDSLTEKDIEKILSDRSLQRQIRDMLGWLEHMALGVNSDIFDKETVYRMSGSNLIRIFVRMRLYIQTAQKGNPRAYIELVQMIRDFEEERRVKPVVNFDGRSREASGSIARRVNELEEQD